MKFKFKLLAAAAALAMASAPAFAGIDTTTNPSLLFVAFDGSGQTADTYVRILGSLNSIGTNNVSFNAPGSSIFSTQFAGVAASNIYWNVFALDNSSPNIFLTGVSATTLNGLGLGSFDVSANAGILTGGLGGLTQLDIAANGYAKPNGEYTGSTNGSDQTNALKITPNFQFGLYDSGHGVGTSLNFKEVSGADGSATQLFLNSALSAFSGDAKGGYFTLTDAAGDVTWTGQASVAAVPLPAAALLFAPGVLTLLGIGRRRKSA